MVEVVPVEGQVLEQVERLLWAVDFRDSDGAVERHDRGRSEREEMVVEREDLLPVGLGRGVRVGVGLR